jgi:hypothetical protein
MNVLNENITIHLTALCPSEQGQQEWLIQKDEPIRLPFNADYSCPAHFTWLDRIT